MGHDAPPVERTDDAGDVLVTLEALRPGHRPAVDGAVPPLGHDGVVVDHDAVDVELEHASAVGHELGVVRADGVWALWAAVVAVAPEVVRRVGHERGHQGIEAAGDLRFEMGDHRLEHVAMPWVVGAGQAGPHHLDGPVLIDDCHRGLLSVLAPRLARVPGAHASAILVISAVLTIPRPGGAVEPRRRGSQGQPAWCPRLCR
jgi:hypothetical protein